MMNRANIVLLAVILLMSSGARATDVSGELALSATVSANCRVNSGALNFNTYDPTGIHATAPLDRSGTFRLTCTNGTAATVKLGQGQNGTGTLAAPVRQLKHGLSDLLGYQLYSDTTREVVWEGETGISYTGNGDSETKTVYGRIPFGQNVAPGAYADSVQITVTY